MSDALVLQRVPDERHLPAGEVVQRALEAPGLPPFDPALVALCARLARGLRQHPASRRHPELVALAFWLREAELTRLAASYRALETTDTILVPRGLVFHVPPGNVDTISVYSWALSVLAGNRNLVRLSSRPSEVTEAIVAALGAALAEAPEAVRAGNALLTYGHEEAVTAALSAQVDARVVWGGDATVRAIRRVALPPHAVEFVFPDRWSLALLGADAWRALDEGGRRDLAERFFNDAWWFDQLGCASPRLVAWLGPDGEGCGREFFALVTRVVHERGWQAETGTALEKLVFAHRAVLDGPVTALFRPDNAVTVLQISTLRGLSREHTGGGLFYQVALGSLDELVATTERRDQTLTHFGIPAEQLKDLARRLNGRGIDRMVPVGQALAFHRYWDGWDLLQALSRRVHVEVGR